MRHAAYIRLTRRGYDHPLEVYNRGQLLNWIFEQYLKDVRRLRELSKGWILEEIEEVPPGVRVGNLVGSVNW